MGTGQSVCNYEFPKVPTEGPDCLTEILDAGQGSHLISSSHRVKF